jgi:uroporphyrinogen decarboxylase
MKAGTKTGKPILQVLSGESVWPPPAWLMRQAGRHLPEYRATRAQAGSFMELCLNPELAAEVTLQPVRRYGVDAAILFSDILIVPWAMGQGLTFAEGEGPRLPPIRDRAGLAALDVAGAAAKAAPIMGTVRRVRAALEAEHPGTTLIGFAGGLWTVACYMVEGKGGGEFKQARRLIHEDPGLLRRADREARGGDAGLPAGPGRGGRRGPDDLRQLGRAIAAERLPGMGDRPHGAAAGGAEGGAAGHPGHRLPPAGRPHAGRIRRGHGGAGGGMDTAMDPAWAAAHLPAATALQGNLDPEALLAGGEALQRQAEGILAAVKGRPFIFNLGHGVEQPTPPSTSRR